MGDAADDLRDWEEEIMDIACLEEKLAALTAERDRFRSLSEGYRKALERIKAGTDHNYGATEYGPQEDYIHCPAVEIAEAAIAGGEVKP